MADMSHEDVSGEEEVGFWLEDTRLVERLGQWQAPPVEGPLFQEVTAADELPFPVLPGEESTSQQTTKLVADTHLPSGKLLLV